MISNSKFYIVCITIYMFLCFSSVILSCSQFLVFPHFLVNLPLPFSFFVSRFILFSLIHSLPLSSFPYPSSLLFYSSFFVLLSHLMCLLAALYNDTYIQHLLPNNIESCFLIILIFLSCHYWYFIPQKLLVKVSKIANPKVL